MLERRRLAGDLGVERTLAAPEVVERLLAEPQRLRSFQPADRALDPIAEPLREIRGEDRSLPRSDQPVQRPALRFGELHASMLGGAADMPETPDDILRALADPERLAIAGALARGEATATSLAETLGLPIKRVRTHLNRLTATGVARLTERRAYRLDPETLRWAAEQVGPPREAGMALGAANEDEEVGAQDVLPARSPDGDPHEAVETVDRPGAESIEFEPGRRYDEREVNVVVGAFFNDYAAIRRSLVDEGFLDRDHGVYWRTGGRVDV